MMRNLFLFWLCCGQLLAHGQQGMAAPDTIAAYPLSVTERYTTNLLFPAAIFKVDLGSGDVLARKEGKMENVLLLKANRAGIASTNVSVYLSNGRFYSFVVSYADSLSSFNYSFCGAAPRVQFTGAVADAGQLDSDAVAVVARASGKGFGLGPKGVDAGLRLSLKGLFYADGLLWMAFAAHNGSMIDFEREGVRFSIEDRSRVRRTAVQSVDVEPVFLRGGDFLAGGRRMPMVAALRPVSIARDKRLVVEWREARGGRRVRVVISSKQLRRTKKIK